jgi:hypothetical protein
MVRRVVQHWRGVAQDRLGTDSFSATFHGHDPGVEYSCWLSRATRAAGIDAGGHPVEGRDRFLGIVKDRASIILSGDQHLSLAVTHDDFGVNECASPAVVNDVWFRLNLEQVGESHVDPFGNPYTLRRVWNAGQC